MRRYYNAVLHAVLNLNRFFDVDNTLLVLYCALEDRLFRSRSGTRIIQNHPHLGMPFLCESGLSDCLEYIRDVVKFGLYMYV